MLPFKVLRPAPEVDFLAFSLPDAITVSLSGLDSLTVRSSLAAARFSEGALDLRAVASELSVEAAITGTLLHAGKDVRVALQLVEVPSGTVRWSHTAQVPLADLFTIQDSVCAAVVDAFALKLSRKEHEALRQDVPASPEAYEHYLRANRLSTTSTQWVLARDLYTRAVEADPSYAPAWARLGRVLRNIGKYTRTPDAPLQYQRAEEAFQRAFALNPELPLTHNLFTYMEVETGRALDAVLRQNFADGDGRLPRTLEKFLGDRGQLRTFVTDLFDESRRDSAMGRMKTMLGGRFWRPWGYNRDWRSGPSTQDCHRRL